MASGEGTTTEALVRAWADKPDAPSVCLVICNNKNAGVFKRIENLNSEFGLDIQTALINSASQPSLVAPEAGHQTDEEQEAILAKLKEAKVDLVLLAGYMKMIGPKLVQEFGWRDGYKSPYRARMLNSHPGLLPDTIGYIGIHVQQQVLTTGRAGHTLHVVSDKYDEGPVIAEHKVEVKPGDTAETLFARVQASERKYLPEDLANFIQKRRQYMENKK